MEGRRKKNGRRLSWEGRRLLSVVDGGFTLLIYEYLSHLTR